MSKFQANRELYERLSKPIAKADAEAALSAFIDGVSDLRVKYGIPELVCASAVYVQVEDEETIHVLTNVMQRGDAIRNEELAATAFTRVRKTGAEALLAEAEGKA